MISDKTILKFSFLVSLLGIIALFFIVQSLEPLSVSVSEINESLVGKNVILSGFVKSSSLKDAVLFMTLSDNSSSVSVVMFSPVTGFNKNDYVLVRGKVDTYKGELEVIANSIEVM